MSENAIVVAAVRLWRYTLPPEKYEGWATIVLGSDGFFAAVTDFGNYAYRWMHHGCSDFREFVVGLVGSDDYLLGKIARHEYRFDGEATGRGIRQHICETRRCGSFTKEKAREEWDLVDRCDIEGGGEIAYHEWYLNTDIQDAYEYRSESYSWDARNFASKIMPRLAAILKAELAAEAKEVA